MATIGKTIAGHPIFQDLVNQAIGQFHDAGILLTAMTSILFVVLGIMSLMDLSGLGWIKRLICLILGIYLPSLITGIDMMIGGITELDNTIAHIWYFWSDYKVIRRKFN